MTPTGTTQKISLSQILETGNVRDNYSDIEELAQSIRENGLMQPVVVKRTNINADGIQQYELIAGHRRKKAFEYLCSQGEDFTLIDAIVKTGDKLTLQLIENIQRKDLTAEEREAGIAALAETDLSQKEIARKLSKSEQWVSKQLAAYRVRKVLTEKNIDTTKFETGILNVFRTAPETELIPLIKRLEIKGINRTNAEFLMQELRQVSAPQTEQPKTIPPTEKEPGQILPIEKPQKSDTAEKPKLQQNNNSVKPLNTTIYGEEIEAEDRLLSAKAVFTEINAYIKAIQDNLNKAESQEIENAKINAAYDIIALLHERI